MVPPTISRTRRNLLKKDVVPKHALRYKSTVIRQLTEMKEHVAEFPPLLAVPESSRTTRKGMKSFRDESRQIRVFSRANPDMESVLQNEHQSEVSGLHDDPLSELAVFNMDAITSFHVSLLQASSFWDQMRNPITDFDSKTMSAIPLVHAAHIHRYLCGPYGGRRACVFGDMCFARTLEHPHGPVTAVEFMDEEEDRHFQETGQLPKIHSMCYFCYLYYANATFKSIDRKNKLPHYTYSTFRVICGIKGEYKVEDCLQPRDGSSEGILVPVRKFSTRDYIPVEIARMTADPTSTPLLDSEGNTVPGWVESGNVFF